MLAIYEQPPAHTTVCAMVAPVANEATWQKRNGGQGFTTYNDFGDHIRLSNPNTPRLVKYLITHETGTRIRIGCKVVD